MIRKDSNIRKVVFFAFLAAIITVIFAFPISLSDTQLADLRDFVNSFGVLSPLAYMLILSLAIIVVPLPSAPLVITSGVLFGSLLGGVYSVLGSSFGALIAFSISRFFGRHFIRKIFKRDYHIFHKHVTNKYIARLIFLSRMVPFFQFDIVSYAAGLTRVGSGSFVIATALGTMPHIIIYVTIGRTAIENSFVSSIFSAVLVLLMFLVPYLIKNYNFLNLKDKLDI